MGERVAEQQPVDRQVPQQHRPQRRCEQVDALAGADVVGRQAEHRPGEHRPPDPACVPQPARQPLRGGGFARREALHRVPGATGDEALGIGLGCVVLQREPGGPGTIFIVPARAGGLHGLERLQQRDLARGGLVHRLTRTKDKQRSGSCARPWRGLSVAFVTEQPSVRRTLRPQRDACCSHHDMRGKRWLAGACPTRVGRLLHKRTGLAPALRVEAGYAATSMYSTRLCGAGMAIPSSRIPSTWKAMASRI